MIYIDLKGNLGNQMFEYALARMIQEKTKQKICVNTYFLSKYKPEYKCNLDKFVLNKNVIFENEKKLPWYVNTYSGLIKYIKKLFPKILFNIMKIKGIFIWLHEEYILLPINKNIKNYYLVGYWQSLKYFKDIDDIIKKEFTAKTNNSKINQFLYDKILNTESICVTIRRGDYVTNNKKHFFYVIQIFL